MTQCSVIPNWQYPTQFATLFQPTGPVVGFHRIESAGQEWEVVVIGGSQITLKNCGTGTYASAAYEAQGSTVVGSFESYTWQQLPVPGGWYQIATTDGKFVWRLTGGEDNDPVVLQATPYTGKDAQWGYNPGN